MSKLIEETGKDKQWITPEKHLKPVYAMCEDGIIGLDPAYNNRAVLQAKTAWSIDNVFIRNEAGIMEPKESKISSDTFNWEWSGHGLVFCNPPYGNESEPFLNKFKIEHAKGVEIIALVPCRTDTKRWHKHVTAASAICLKKSRIKFINFQTQKEEGSPKFPSAYLYYGSRLDLFKENFKDVGHVLVNA